jgi:predicted ribosomally synthesized peptide with SipW-like signal peptide
VKKILFSIMAVGLAIGLVGGAFAYFSDTATSTTNSFTAGTLSITNSELTGATAFTIPNMAPGDVSPEYSVIIRNDGSINLGWLGDWQFTADAGAAPLYDALYIDYAKMEFLTPNGLGNWAAEGTDTFITKGVGSGPYPTWYNTLAAASLFGVVSLNQWNDNAGMVPGSVYEHAGALKPGYAYRLTVKFGMAELAGDAYQGLGAVKVKLQVNATQIKSAALQAKGVPVAQADWLAGTFMPNQIADQVELP